MQGSIYFVPEAHSMLPKPPGGAITSFADEDSDAAAKTQAHPQDWKG